MPIENWSDTIWLVKLSSEPELSEDLNAARERLNAAEAMPDIVLDFSDVNHLNSSNLTQILRIRKVCIERDAKLLLAGLNDGIWAVFLTTSLDKIFEFQTDAATALAALQMEA